MGVKLGGQEGVRGKVNDDGVVIDDSFYGEVSAGVVMERENR